jgi:dGTPase
VGWQNGRSFTHLIRHETIREVIGRSLIDVLTQTDANLEQNQLDSAEKVQTHSSNVVSYSPDFGPKVRALKKFLYANMYHHYRLVRMQVKAERFISELFNAYLKEPKMLPSETQQQLAHAPLHRVITDYIAGMTDRYALDEWEKLFNPYSRA